MRQTVIDSVREFQQLEGQNLGQSEWLEVTQEIINKFADATFDHQWIHVDEQRAKHESPYNSTIAHGYLTLSFLPYLLNQILHVNNLKQVVNYGIEKMIFKSIVPANSRLRLNVTLKSAMDLGDICKANIYCTFEIEGQEKPVLEGSIIYLYYFY